MIAEIEAALVGRVRELMAPLGVAADAYPDGAGGHPFTHPAGTVLVVNTGSRYDAPEKTGRPVQQRTLAFELIVQMRNLRSHEGAYAVIDALARGLAGWRPRGPVPPGSHPDAVGPLLAMYGTRLEKDGFVSHEAGVWAWSVQVAVPGAIVAPEDPEPAAVPITSITGDCAPLER